MNRFDVAIEARLRAEQKAGRVATLNARETARALNRLDAAYLILCFGRRPQADPSEVTQVIASIWISTVYGCEVLNKMNLLNVGQPVLAQDEKNMNMNTQSSKRNIARSNK